MKRVIIRNVLILVVTLFLSIFLVYSSNIYFFSSKNHVSSDMDTTIPKETRLSLVMVGDGLIHGAVYSDAYHNGWNFHPGISG